MNSERYVFWPQHLNSSILYSRNEEWVIIAIALRGTDYVVLDAVPRGLIRGKELESSPYIILGRRDKHSLEWEINCQKTCIIEFKVPKIELLQFFSLEPISLCLPEKEYEYDLQDDCKECEGLYRLWSHPRYQAHERRIRQSLRLLNLFSTHRAALYDRYPHYSRKEFTKSSNKIVSLMWYKIKVIRNFLAMFGFYATIFACRVSTGIYLMLNNSYLPLVNLSVTAQQIDLRCQQISYFPVQYLRINTNASLRRALPRFRTYSEASANLRRDLPSTYYPDYIRFYNTLWLMFNDISFGLIMGSILLEECDKISLILHKAITYCLYDFIKSVTFFLAKNPVGIKLNEELAFFLSDLFLWTIDFSNVMFITPLADIDNLKFFIKGLANISSVFGGTLALSMIVDYFSILSIHIYLFYRISSKIYHWQLNVMVSLFYLFCGKKKNVLRNRVDKNFFELDELLLGTLFFIILVFLTPTVVTFYFSYTVLRMGAIAIEVILESIIALLNHFPLFALLLRAKDPMRIPGGISLRFTRNENTKPHFELRNKPLSIYSMFKPFIVLMDHIRHSFYSTKTLRQIVLGLPITIKGNKSYQILYSSLPKRPIDVQTLQARWKQFTNTKESKMD